MTTLADAIAAPAGININSTIGRQAAAGSKSVALATDDSAVLASLATKLYSVIAAVDGLEALATTLNGYAADTTTDSPVAVHQPCDIVTVTPTLDTSIYASGDILFTTTAVSNAVRANDGLAMLNSLVVVDKDDQKPEFALKFWSSNVTYGTFNAAPSISDADAANCLGRINIDGGVSTAFKDNIGKLLKAASGTRTIYITGKLTAGTPTHTASGLVIRLGLVWA
jgi:hypothetical protein